MIGSFAATFVNQLAHTLDWRISGLEQWNDGAVLLCWHGEIVLAAAFIIHVKRAAACWTPIVPEYGESAIMTQFARQLGVRPFHVPGYEQPDERRAALMRLIPHLQAGQSVFLAADGHRAPARMLGEDPLWLATTANVPLLPMAFAARPALTLPTWDRKVLAFPRSRAAARLSAAMRQPVTPEQIEAQLAESAERAADMLR